MDWDEARAKAPAAAMQIGDSLDRLSIGELEARLASLDAEIARIKSAIAAKKAHQAAAGSIFKSS